MEGTDRRLQHLDDFGTSPILGVHLLLDAKVFEYPHMVLPGHEVHWIFNKGCNAEGQQHLHAVISAADDWMHLDEAVTAERVFETLCAAVPAARDRSIVNVRSVKEKRATFAATAEIEPKRPCRLHRPSAHEAVTHRACFLPETGATGWPATMEGAAKRLSGRRSGLRQRRLVPDLPPDRLAGLMAVPETTVRPVPWRHAMPTPDPPARTRVHQPQTPSRQPIRRCAWPLACRPHDRLSD